MSHPVIKDADKHLAYYFNRYGIPGIAALAVHLQQDHGYPKSYTDGRSRDQLLNDHADEHPEEVKAKA